MLLTIWTAPSGYKFTNNGQPFQEQVALDIILPTAHDTGVNYSIISGALPGGLAITYNTAATNWHITGSPYIVSNLISYQFCIRASATAQCTSGTFSNGSFIPGEGITGTFLTGMVLTGKNIPRGTYIVSDNGNGTFAINTTVSIVSTTINGSGFADRTFSMEVNGINAPIFITPAGELAVGIHHQLYALDQSYINYQLEGFDLNVLLGSTLKYFIASGDGHLPPGLTLSDSGIISGYILPNPQTIITTADGNGTFDQAYFDATGYDFALIPTDGYDSYEYEDVRFDYSSPAVLPNSLNQNYQFKVTLTDGITFIQRIFKIFVLGTDSFKADSTVLDGFAGSFTADATFLRNPVWLTAANLGTYRANNYITVPVALYDNNNVLFRLEKTNMEVYAVTKRINSADNNAGGTSITITNVSKIPTVGQYLTFDNYIHGATEKTYQISHVDNLGDDYYRLTITSPLELSLPNLSAFYIGTLSKLPPGTDFDIQTGELFGRVPYQPQITLPYTFTITATRLSASPTNIEHVETSKTFNIVILGSVTSEIIWKSPSNLGIIPANYICTLDVSASSNVPNATILYYLTSGSLPPGLTLNVDGEIIGMPNQYYNSSTGELGLTTFHDRDNHGNIYTNQTLDHGQTTVDRSYTFTITASDQYQYSAAPKTFTITVSTPNTVAYSNITTQPFLEPTQRSAWQAFINDTSIFTPSSIYRVSDSNFGIQSNLTMLVYAGIQTEAAAAYVGAIGLGVKRKRFKFDTVKTATAIDPVSGNTVYEVVYVQMLDPLESNGKHLPLSFKTKSTSPTIITVDDSNSIWSTKLSDLTALGSAVRPEYNITVDSTGYETSNPNTNTYYPNSITNWQTRLSKTVDHYTTINGNQVPVAGLSERNYLPLWMRSIPIGSKEQLGYVLCVPLCFCKPGTSAAIALNIKHSNFNFNKIDYTVDRFTISAVTGYTSDKYLVFRDDRITV
jgi:hypothetical protein